eukprot:CAMPEP_0170176718 /NCGR_PEP_ID=MMETSP0040_2-20121228/9535_1 /TAXON_ID=641309 /ORGANISM="Lotharella oceanica, Strain CCMP622" /LENGTH=247 /DNA_ID=CAMNT_0010419135 /DNA_START=56 /DNA_END=799 /DNA_ORIENTATION=+
MAPVLKKQLAAFPKGEEVVAQGSQKVRLSWQKVFLPGQTLVTVFITNVSSTASNVVASLNTQQGLFLRCDSSPKAQLKEKQDLHTQAINISTLGEAKTATMMVGIFTANPQVISANDIHVRVHIGGAPVAECRIPLDAKDLIRPQTMTVQQYGGQWKRLGNEAKDQLQGSSVQSADALGAIANKNHMKLVKVIGTECIIAAKLVTGNKTMLPVLLHGKVKGGNIIFMCRSPSKSLSAAVISMIKAAC